MFRIVAHKHLVDFENRAELAVECGGVDVRQVEIDLILAADAHPIETDLKDFACCDVARDEIAVGGYFSSRK